MNALAADSTRKPWRCEVCCPPTGCTYGWDHYYISEQSWNSYNATLGYNQHLPTPTQLRTNAATVLAYANEQEANGNLEGPVKKAFLAAVENGTFFTTTPSTAYAEWTLTYFGGNIPQYFLQDWANGVSQAERQTIVTWFQNPANTMLGFVNVLSNLMNYAADHLEKYMREHGGKLPLRHPFVKNPDVETICDIAVVVGLFIGAVTGVDEVVGTGIILGAAVTEVINDFDGWDAYANWAFNF
jgi:hypothetical protein